MELEKIDGIDFTDDTMNKLVKRLQNLFNNQQKDFANTCYTIYMIRQWFKDNVDCVLRMRKTSEYFNEKQLFQMLGINNRMKQRYSQCYEKYMTLEKVGDDVDAKLREPFVSFAPSKLIELLPYSNATIEELIASGAVYPSMTVKQIRNLFVVSEKKALLEDMSDLEMEEECVAGEFEDNFIILPNDTSRLDFLDNFRTWGLWFEEKRLGLRYYRCKIGEDTIVAVLSQYSLPNGEKMDSVTYHKINSIGCLDMTPISKTEVISKIRHSEDSKVVLFER